MSRFVTGNNRVSLKRDPRLSDVQDKLLTNLFDDDLGLRATTDLTAELAANGLHRDGDVWVYMCGPAGDDDRTGHGL